MSTLHELKKEVKNVTGEYNMNTDKQSPKEKSQPSMLDKILKPPIIYMIGIVFGIGCILLYQQPCFVCKEEPSEIERKKNIDIQWYLISVILFSSVCICMAMPYLK